MEVTFPMRVRARGGRVFKVAMILGLAAGAACEPVDPASTSLPFPDDPINYTPGATSGTGTTPLSGPDEPADPAVPSFVLRWDAVSATTDLLQWSGGPADPLRYIVEQYTYATGWVALATLDASTTSYLAARPSDGSLCCYRVRAEQSNGVFTTTPNVCSGSGAPGSTGSGGAGAVFRVQGVVTHEGVGLSGVRVSATNGGGAATTGTDGAYSIDVPAAWSGMIIASAGGYTFEPAYRSLTNVSAGVVGLDFVASISETPPNATVVATDFPSLQAAVDALPADGGMVYLPAGNYLMSSPLNLRNRRCVVLQGAGPRTIISDVFSPTNAAYPVVDMVGAHVCELRQLDIRGQYARVGLLLGRSDVYKSAGLHVFDSVSVTGTFTLASVVNVTSEANRWRDCTFQNSKPGGHAYILSGKNYYDVTSPYGPMAYTASNVTQTFDGCYWNVSGNTGTEACLVMHGPLADVWLFNSNFSGKTTDFADPAKGALCGIWFNCRDAVIYNVLIQGGRAETEGSRNFIRYDGGPWVRTSFVTVANVSAYSREEAILAGYLIQGWEIRENLFRTGYAEYPWSNKTLVRLHSAQDSTVDLVNSCRAWPLPAGTAAVRVDGASESTTYRVLKTADAVLAGPNVNVTVTAVDE